ncbi:MAG: AAA family ATPase [Candidatus Sericytochromatia bacterium]
MKKLPIGKQTFRDLINENNLYVDKTEDIYNLLNDNAKYFFLSRPRRFGKSLLISTLEEIFSGNQELFKGLYIYDKIEWKKYPVIKIDFAKMDLSSLEKLVESLNYSLNSIAESYKVLIDNTLNYKLKFISLIKELGKFEKVVILIDEYDKPIIDHINNLEVIKEMRDILKNFYVTIKASDEFIKFAFLTGVSKFSKVSIFSDLNNLRDITLEEKFATILGYTQEELESYFRDHIKETAKELNVEENYLKESLKTWYNGYSWDGKNFVYNPFSILNVLTTHDINNYWFQSGTPTFLIKLIKEKNIDIKSLENYEADFDSFSEYDIENINVISLLFQAGYLTIKKINRDSLGFKTCNLEFPNLEVKESFLKNILMNFSESFENNIVIVKHLSIALIKNNLEEFFKILKDIFSHIPNEIFMADKERYYHTIIYLILTLIGVRIKAEVSTNIGRVDAVIETQSHIYIFEFKMSSSKKVIKQIEDKKYYESYLLSNKEIFLVGVSFDPKERNIKDWKIEILIKNK